MNQFNVLQNHFVFPTNQYTTLNHYHLFEVRLINTVENYTLKFSKERNNSKNSY